MSLQIAQAAVNDANIHFDRLYSYCVPPRLVGRIWPGSMVLAPFGRGNKPRMAVVLDVQEVEETPDSLKTNGCTPWPVNCPPPPNPGRASLRRYRRCAKAP